MLGADRVNFEGDKMRFQKGHAGIENGGRTCYRRPLTETNARAGPKDLLISDGDPEVRHAPWNHRIFLKEKNTRMREMEVWIKTRKGELSEESMWRGFLPRFSMGLGEVLIMDRLKCNLAGKGRLRD